MKCHYCGKEVLGEQKFCNYCGTRQMPPAAQKQSREPEKNEPETSVLEKYEPEIVEQQPEATASGADRGAPREEEAPLYVPEYPPVRSTPRIQLPCRRGLGKIIFLGLVTLGIYPAVIWSRIVTELNLAASRYDGERTMPYFGMLMLAPVTLGIYTLVWSHGFCRRVGAELSRRGFYYKFGASTFWLWNVLGSLILVGPFIFVHKLTKSMNFINADFNTNG